ncbi:single-stranded DNA-binding protein [Aerococcus sanguinicola]|uniref:single-stranded DNA-binding protein n=1 Tax=unclassified Aerococcus TaxID=2618060 RepID=UPI0008A65086|nr:MULTISPECIES: single-stranded DNA-binding protein [unclassified Aerococcus]KAB0646737.1 single-stranded DNA-binding protein [Aerococcus sanguinicola]MDK6233885.1 single-stranded DNA-binding protein [Aerococcus sp. UMB10185]MDK6805667.1 single-stranded DNA-binding protein [Aerococcus sp. UMB7834]MDK6856641.1 single-stranded DNA-binding protein [Aerococcus sp. UMB7533]MDK8502749.1 single-stranded DNA-binding protein [Aerococcus sp. UMB1112A]
MINNVVLVGRLTREVDLRYTQSGIAVANFTVACDRNFRNSQGETETDFISCVMWRKSAENFAKFTRKGSLVGIEGSIQTRNYENQQGQRVYVTEVLANNFSLLEPKSVTESRPQSNNNSYGNNAYQGNNFGSSNQNQDPFASQANQDPFASNDNSSPFSAGGFGNDNPFASGNNDQNQSSNNDGASINIADDDLPF